MAGQLAHRELGGTVRPQGNANQRPDQVTLLPTSVAATKPMPANLGEGTEGAGGDGARWFRQFQSPHRGGEPRSARGPARGCPWPRPAVTTPRDNRTHTHTHLGGQLD